MSFFTGLGLSNEVVNDESANVQAGGFKKINGGTQAVAIIHSAKWNEGSVEHNIKRHIVVKFKLTNTSFEGCFADFKAHICADDIKKRQSSANLLSRLYLLTGVAVPAALPTDIDLASFNNKMLGIEVAYWCMQSNDSVWRDGNWINGLHSSNGFVPVEGTEVPKDINALNMPTQSAAPKTPPTTSQAPAQQSNLNEQAPQQQGSWGS